MELRHLRYFVAVAEEGTVTGAAAKLYVAQPALSRQLRDLERGLGCRLFERHSRGVVLTEAGFQLLPQARRLLDDADRLVTSMQERQRPTRERFVVGLLEEGAAELTAPILRAFRACRPSVQLSVVPVPYGPHNDALRTGQVDALIGMDVAEPRARATTLYLDGRLAMLPSRHPLADAHQVSVADLLDEPAPYLRGVPQTMLDTFLLTEERNGERVRTVQPGESSIDDLLDAVAHDNAVMTVTTASERYMAHPGVTYRPIPEAPWTTTSVLVQPSAEEDGRVLRDEFVAVAQRTARELIDLVPGARLPDLTPAGA